MATSALGRPSSLKEARTCKPPPVPRLQLKVGSFKTVFLNIWCCSSASFKWLESVDSLTNIVNSSVYLPNLQVFLAYDMQLCDFFWCASSFVRAEKMARWIFVLRLSPFGIQAGEDFEDGSLTYSKYLCWYINLLEIEQVQVNSTHEIKSIVATKQLHIYSIFLLPTLHVNDQPLGHLLTYLAVEHGTRDLGPRNPNTFIPAVSAN